MTEKERGDYSLSSTNIATLAKVAAICALYISVLCTFLYMARASLRLHLTANLRLISRNDGNIVQQPIPRVALVTMAAPSFLNCSIRLFRSARRYGWRQPMFLLAIQADEFDIESLEELDQLGVTVVRTAAALDKWVENMGVLRKYHYRRMNVVNFRKMEIFYNPLFRTFNRVIYMDPDGEIAAPLVPLELMTFPERISILMRQNEATLGKPSLWKGEVDPAALKTPERQLLESAFPDRTKVGASCWFMVDMAKLPSPRDILEESRRLLCMFKAAFRFNDQTLINLLFYHSLDLFPWCSSSELQVIGQSNRLRSYCEKHMNDQRWMNGGLTFMYRHHSPFEKAQCRRKRTDAEFDIVHKGRVFEGLCPAMEGRSSLLSSKG